MFMSSDLRPWNGVLETRSRIKPAKQPAAMGALPVAAAGAAVSGKWLTCALNRLLTCDAYESSGAGTPVEGEPHVCSSGAQGSA